MSIGRPYDRTDTEVDLTQWNLEIAGEIPTEVCRGNSMEAFDLTGEDITLRFPAEDDARRLIPV